MMQVLVYTSSPLIEELLQYNNFLDMEFHYCYLPAQAVATYVHYRPSFFILHCASNTLQELSFIRSLSRKLPIFALTTSTDDNHVAQLLEQGADYLVHIPCGAQEIRAQLHNFLRLTLGAQKEQTSNILHIGELKIFLKNNQVMLGEEYLALTLKEYKLLLALAHNLNKVVDSESLYQAVYPQGEVNVTSRSLNMHLSNLRRKLHLEDYTKLCLKTKRGKGVGLFYLTDATGGENHA